MRAAIKDALLLVSTDNPADSIASTLQGAGYEVGIATSKLRAVALLFLMRTFAAVVIDGRAHQGASLDLASRLHGIRAQIPIIVVGQQPGLSPVAGDACITEQELPGTLQVLLKASANSLEAPPLASLPHAN